jgi:hypothetical protein
MSNDDIQYQGLTLVELAEAALKKPDDFGWWGKEEMFVSWGWAGIDMSNASDAVAITNFEVITKDLMSKFPDDFDIVGLRHWAVGHCDRLICKILNDDTKPITADNITDAFKASMEWLINLDDYPIADDDRLSDYCYQEMLEWITSELPDEVYVAESKESTAAQILEEMCTIDDFDPVGWSLNGMAPDDDLIKLVAYDLSLCSAEYIDFWDEWVDSQSLPPILWGENRGFQPNVVHEINGQLNLFEDE